MDISVNRKKRPQYSPYMVIRLPPNQMQQANLNNRHTTIFTIRLQDCPFRSPKLPRKDRYFPGKNSKQPYTHDPHGLTVAVRLLEMPVR
jgi:hypothetical protein